MNRSQLQRRRRVALLEVLYRLRRFSASGHHVVGAVRDLVRWLLTRPT